MLTKVLEHALLALPFMATGWFLKGMCHHFWDRFVLGSVLLFTEATIMVVVLPH